MVYLMQYTLTDRQTDRQTDRHVLSFCGAINYFVTILFRSAFSLRVFRRRDAPFCVLICRIRQKKSHTFYVQ